MINRLEKLGRGLWKRKRKILILMLKTGLAAVVAVGVLVAVSEWYADSASRGRLFDHPRDRPRQGRSPGAGVFTYVHGRSQRLF